MMNLGIIPPNRIRKYLGVKFKLIINDEIMIINIISYDDKNNAFTIDGVALSKLKKYKYILEKKILMNPCRILDVLQVAIKNSRHKIVYQNYSIEIICCFDINKKINKILNL